MVLAAAEARYLTEWQKELAHPLTIRWQRNQRPQSQALAEFVADWQGLVKNVAITEEDIAETALPGLVLGDRWYFHAVPEGVKLSLLGEILLALAGQPAALPAGLREGWGQLPLAPELTIFVAPQCPFCPQMVRQLIPLTTATPAATVTLVDVSLFPEVAREHDIKAVPTVLVNGIYRLTGAFQLGDILALAAKTDPALLPTGVMERMMQEGQAGLVGELMLSRGEVFANFLPLLWHPEINIRLGAMVALETVGAERPSLVAAVLPALWQAGSTAEPAVLGDLIYLIGEWGDDTWLPSLTDSLGRTTDADVQEALEEAVAKIQERGADAPSGPGPG